MASGNNRRPAQKATPPQPPMDPEQREQAMRFMQLLAGRGTQQEYTPILKSLKQIGITPKNMTVMVGDEPMDCLVIPLQDLMTKEWLHMSGQDTGAVPVDGPTEVENS